MLLAAQLNFHRILENCLLVFTISNY